MSLEISFDDQGILISTRNENSSLAILITSNKSSFIYRMVLDIFSNLQTLIWTNERRGSGIEGVTATAHSLKPGC